MAGKDDSGVEVQLNQFPTHLLKLHFEKNYGRNSRINMSFTVMLGTTGGSEDWG